MISFMISVVPPKMDGVTAIIWAARTHCPRARRRPQPRHIVSADRPGESGTAAEIATYSPRRRSACHPSASHASARRAPAGGPRSSSSDPRPYVRMRRRSVLNLGSGNREPSMLTSVFRVSPAATAAFSWVSPLASLTTRSHSPRCTVIWFAGPGSGTLRRAGRPAPRPGRRLFMRPPFTLGRDWVNLVSSSAISVSGRVCTANLAQSNGHEDGSTNEAQL
jgi:hypothetical protein